MCPKLITQPILCQAYTGLRVTDTCLFVVNKIVFSQTETEIIMRQSITKIGNGASRKKMQ